MASLGIGFIQKGVIESWRKYTQWHGKEGNSVLITYFSMTENVIDL